MTDYHGLKKRMAYKCLDQIDKIIDDLKSIKQAIVCDNNKKIAEHLSETRRSLDELEKLLQIYMQSELDAINAEVNGDFSLGEGLLSEE